MTVSHNFSFIMLTKQDIKIIACCALATYAVRKPVKAAIAFAYSEATDKHYATRTQRLSAWLLDKTSSSLKNDYRQIFKESAIDKSIKQPQLDNHSHAEAAGLRTVANTFIDLFATIIHQKAYSVSGSPTEFRNGKTGNRLPYVAKDLQVESRSDAVQDNMLIKMVDVDYYVDMPRYMDGHNIVLYTFVPTKVAGTSEDAIYTINSNDELIMHVKGGATYQHQLWDYNVDHVLVNHGFHSWLYLVERKSMSNDRQLVFLNAIRKIYWPFTWLVSGDTLRRKIYNTNGILSNSYLQDDDYLVSLGEPNAFVSIELPVEQLHACKNRLLTGKVPALSDIERILRSYNNDDPVLCSGFVMKFLTSSPTLAMRFASRGIESKRHFHYQTMFPLVTEDGADTMRIVGPVLCNGAVAASRSFNNDNACIKGRVRDVANPIKTYPPVYWQWLDEFVRFLVPDHIVGTLVPYDYTTQKSQFSRPTQQALLAQAEPTIYLHDKWRIRSFQKAEAYAKIAPPRNISTLPMDHNFRLGQFAMALSDNVLKTQPWYAFGKHPSEFTARLRDMTSQTNMLLVMDISKCDGSLGYIHYVLTQAIVIRAFAPLYHKEIMTLLARESRAKGITSFELLYETLNNTLSGSSITSPKNTLANAFNNYCVNRHTLETSAAWDALGIYGGDDGISNYSDPKRVSEIHAQLGMKVEVDVVHVGEPLPFLGRIYIDPWTTNQSMCDVKRQLRKLHLTSAPAIVPDNVVLWRKAEGFLVTDPSTPIISQWALAINRCVPAPSAVDYERFKRYVQESSYFSKTFEAPFEPVDPDIALDVVAKQLDLTTEETRRIIQSLLDCKTHQQFNDLKELYHVDIPVSQSAVINDVVVIHNEQTTQSDRVAKAAEAAPQPPTATRMVGRTLQRKIRECHQTLGFKDSAPPKTKSVACRATRTPRIQPNRGRKAPQGAEPPAPTSSAPLTTAAKSNRRCRFVAKNQPCPYGTNCKFEH